MSSSPAAKRVATRSDEQSVSPLDTQLTRDLGIDVPLICGPMYPCTNPELVAAVSEAGGIGVVQPMSMVYVYGHDFREGLQLIKSMTDKPFGVNLILEATAKVYEDRVKRWTDIAMEEQVKFFTTALGNPTMIVDRVKDYGGIVYHDVTERKWALKAIDAGVDGLICVNSRAGGHAGELTPTQLMEEVEDLGLPMICAGGVGSEQEYVEAIEMGHAGVQMGTRFIATDECRVHPDYKEAIIRADEDDIVLTDKISGVPVAVIKTPYIEEIGTEAGWFAKWMLKGRRTKRIMRTYYAIQSMIQLRKASLNGMGYRDYWQAGKSVAGIKSVEPAAQIVKSYREALVAAG